MRTKDLERELGLTKHTIHYYEKEGFIHPDRDENGYRNYSDEDLQILQLVKFLRNLDISIDDVKAILNGELDFHECLRVNQIHLENQLESMGELQKTVDKYIEKDLPLLPALENIQESSKSHWKFGMQKTTKTVSLGRKLTKAWCIRQLIYGLGMSVVISVGIMRFFFKVYTVPFSIQLIIYLMTTILMELLLIAAAFRETSSMMIDNSLDQSVEFLRDGIRYYQFKNYWDNLKYFISVLFGKEEKAVKFCKYEDIERVELLAKRRYMNFGSPIAYEVYEADFEFQFRNGETFYFLWPTILDDDAKYIAVILEEKVKNIVDKHNIIYAFKHGINLNDYLAGI